MESQDLKRAIRRAEGKVAHRAALVEQYQRQLQDAIIERDRLYARRTPGHGEQDVRALEGR